MLHQYVLVSVVTGIIVSLQVLYIWLPPQEGNGKGTPNLSRLQRRSLEDGECEVIHVAIKCYTEAEVFDCLVLIKSILYHTRSVVTFHLLTSPAGKWVISHYMDTWQPNHVDVTFRLMHTEKLAIDNFMIHPPADVDQLILLRPHLVFITDIVELWDLANTAHNRQYVVQCIDSHLSTMKQQLPHIPLPDKAEKLFNISHTTDGIVIHYPSMRRPNICTDVESIDFVKLRTDVKFMYSMLCPGNLVKYNKNPGDSAMRLLKDLSKISMPALLDRKDKVVCDSLTQPESVTEVLQLSADVLRRRHVNCHFNSQHSHSPNLQSENKTKYIDNSCYQYEYQAQIPRRTHLYFYNMDPSAIFGHVTTTSNIITLVTQLHFNRMSALLKLIDSWEGPMQVVLYLTDGEAELVKEELKEIDRKNIHMHVVYKRQTYVPINVLRNIGISETRTEYVWVVDVDFIPMPGIYIHLLSVIDSMQTPGGKSKTFIVPTFEALHEDYMIPRQKKDLITDIHRGEIQPYHQRPGDFQPGHKPHKYRKWMTADKPYRVYYQFEFEPYIIIKTSDSPLYRTLFVERMMDKYIYTLEVAAKGLEMYVLHDAYIVHIPHEHSISHKLTHNPNFHRCAKVFFEDMEEQLISRKYRVKG